MCIRDRLSPFNFLFLLFSNENLPLAVTLVALLKIGACGFTFYYFLAKVYGGRTKLAILFSTAYALMAYNVVYCLLYTSAFCVHFSGIRKYLCFFQRRKRQRIAVEFDFGL